MGLFAATTNLFVGFIPKPEVFTDSFRVTQVAKKDKGWRILRMTQYLPRQRQALQLVNRQGRAQPHVAVHGDGRLPQCGAVRSFHVGGVLAKRGLK